MTPFSASMMLDPNPAGLEARPQSSYGAPEFTGWLAAALGIYRLRRSERMKARKGWGWQGAGLRAFGSMPRIWLEAGPSDRGQEGRLGRYLARLWASRCGV